MRIVKKYVIGYFLEISIFIILLFLVNVNITKEEIKNNVEKSAVTFQKEGTYPIYNKNKVYLGQDNFTDSLMLNICYSLNSNNSMSSIMEMDYMMEQDGSFNSIDDLSVLTKNSDLVRVSYARYWHGYIIVIKPLLKLFSYSEIRMILFVGLYILITIFLFRLGKKIGWRAVCIYFLSFLMININRLWLSIQYANVFIPTIIIMILLTLEKDERLFSNFNYYSFLAGGIICFFDLLTTPLISIGLMLSYYLLYFIVKKRVEVIQLMKKSVLAILSWGIGYAMIWGTKWIIASVILRKNILLDAFNSAQTRTSIIPDGFSKMDWIKYTLKSNLYYLFEGDYKKEIVFIVVVILLLSVVFYHKTLDIEKLKYASLFVILGSLPYLWYLILSNHSGIHAFFSFRNQIITVVCILTLLFYSIDIKKMLGLDKKVE